MDGRKLTTRMAVFVAGATVATAAMAGASPVMAATAPADSSPVAGTSAAAEARAGEKDGRVADVDYATWKRDVSAVTDEARPYLEQRISQAPGRRWR